MNRISRRTFLYFNSVAGLSVSFGGVSAMIFPEDFSDPESKISILKRGEKQIFADSTMISRSQEVIRKVHPARKLEKPVLEADMSWEQGKEYDGKKDRRIYIYGSVIQEKKSGLFQMWYNRLKSNYFATSSDGIHWNRTELGQFGATNQINLFHFHSPSIIFDKIETDPKKRYKAVGCIKSSFSEKDFLQLKQRHKNFSWYNKSSAYSAAYSADGINWNLYPEPIIMGGDTITLAQDPRTGEYLAFHKNKSTPDDKGRKVFLSTSKDMQNWTEPKLVMEADEIDNRQARKLDGGTHAEIYDMSAFYYGGQWLGLITLFQRTGSPKVKGPGQSGDDGPIRVQLVCSRNGKNWQRCSDRSPVIDLGPYPYDSGSILGVCNTPVIVGDEMWMYYTAMTTTHGGYLPEKQMSIARAAWRIDGMVSLQAAKAQGIVETTAFIPEGDELFINADASKGEILVELLNPDGSEIPGYTKEDCMVITTDSVNQKVKWKNHTNLPSGKTLQLRFYMKNADLFSYTIS